MSVCPCPTVGRKWQNGDKDANGRMLRHNREIFANVYRCFCSSENYHVFVDAITHFKAIFRGLQKNCNAVSLHVTCAHLVRFVQRISSLF